MLTLVGGNFLNRLRKSVLHKVERGLWRELVGSIVAVHGPFSTAGFTYNHPVHPDDDGYEAEVRRRIYQSSM